MSGYTTPPSETKVLAAGGTITFTKVWQQAGGGGGGTPGGCAKQLVAGVRTPGQAASSACNGDLFVLAAGGATILVWHRRNLRHLK